MSCGKIRDKKFFETRSGARLLKALNPGLYVINTWSRFSGSLRNKKLLTITRTWITVLMCLDPGKHLLLG